MNLDFKSSFERDIKKIINKDLKLEIEKSINNVENALNLSDIDNWKKLKGYKTYFRIKINVFC